VKKYLLPFLFIFSCFCLSSASVKEIFSHGCVDWTEGKIFIDIKSRQSSGKITIKKAYKSAQEDLLKRYYQKAKRIINGIRIDSDCIIGTEIEKRNVLSLEVNRMLQETEIRKLEYNIDGTILLKACFPLYGNSGLASIFYNQKTNSAVMGNPSYQKTFLFNFTKIPSNSDEFYTGLIIDARLLNISPALWPKIYDTNNNILYGNKINPNIGSIQERGSVIYVYDISEALGLVARIGENPLVIKAVSAAGIFKTDVLIFEKDAQILRQANNHINFLKSAAVIFVINKKN